MAETTAKSALPLCVDLDGTLIATDLLVESTVALIRTNFFLVFMLPIWFLRGRAYMKKEIARRIQIDAAVLPYRTAVVEWLKEQHAAGRKIILATASDELLAKPVAAHLGLFDEVLASDGVKNLKGSAKCEALVARFGKGGFAYAGDAAADLPIWAAAGEAITVCAAPSVLAKAKANGNVVHSFPWKWRSPRVYTKAMRIHQWAKNVLVFVPVVTAHQIDNLKIDIQAGLGFVSFSLCASAVYLANDLMDLDADRRHHTKRNRPFASGVLPLAFGVIAAPLLVIVAFTLAIFMISPQFTAVLALYFVVTNAYTFRLKREVLLDVLCLASLYTLRIFAGGQLTSLHVSEWLIALSMFAFLSLALVKRVSELRVIKESSGHALHGRGYQVGDLSVLSEAGIASGYLCVLVFALYINSAEVKPLYHYPQVLWFICPLILYWITRVWLLTHRGKMHDDPVLFAVRDTTSYIVGLLAFITMFVAR